MCAEQGQEGHFLALLLLSASAIAVAPSSCMYPTCTPFLSNWTRLNINIVIIVIIIVIMTIVLIMTVVVVVITSTGLV